MPYLICNPGTAGETTFTLQLGLNTIGREADNTIAINEPSLSRHHANVTVQPDGQVLVCDRLSRNYTYVNDVKITQRLLQTGDMIRCGNVLFKFLHSLMQPLPHPEREQDQALTIVKRFSPEHTRVVMQDLLSAEHAGVGTVLKLRQKDAEQRVVDKFKILLEVSKQLSAPETFEQLPETILDLLLDIMSVDRAVLLLVNAATGQLEPRAVKFRAGLTGDAHFYSTRITNFVRENGDAILTADASRDERFLDANSVLLQSIQASICVPLKPRDTVIGVLYADNLSMANVHSQEDLEFMTALANQAAIAIENANLYAQMKSEAVLRAKLERFFPQAISKKIKEESLLGIVDTEVTALFSDISSFTELSSTMEPRQIIEMLNEYFEVMVEEIVFQYEGTLEKYIGDALLAVWGAPYANPQDPIYAVQAAIEMQWAVQRLNQEWMQRRGLQIQVHIGLNTGKVAAGNIGSQKLIQYATIGDTTNVTSRICSAAQAGEILIGELTYQKLHTLGFETAAIVPIPPVMVKGKDQPLQLYQVHWQHMQPQLQATRPR